MRRGDIKNYRKLYLFSNKCSLNTMYANKRYDIFKSFLYYVMQVIKQVKTLVFVLSFVLYLVRYVVFEI